eukprot:m.124431 g.124431  ORF g.124431 m.124431 type:complete len:262 (+) comp17284_c0_seq1:44-829(+)
MHRIGIGTIWCGRVWPPGNTSYVAPTQNEVNAYLSRACLLLPPNSAQNIMLDTAEGYGQSEDKVGQWLKENAAISSNILIATKFGENYDAETAETAVDLSPQAALACLEKSTEKLGRVDIFYSHITSQVSSQTARDVLQDSELKQLLLKLRKDEKVKMIGTSLSHKDVILEALEKGWLSDFDVVQLPAFICVEDSGVVEQCVAQGIMVVVNSPIRKMKALKVNVPDTPQQMYHEVLKIKGISCCLTGTRTHLDETIGYLQS